MIGQAKYDEEIALLKAVEKQDELKGAFQAMGDVDTRDASLRDVTLCSGFDSLCGIRGGKLSGG